MIFSCPKCGKTIIKDETKTLVGCEHYPTEEDLLKGFPEDFKSIFNK